MSPRIFKMILIVAISIVVPRFAYASVISGPNSVYVASQQVVVSGAGDAPIAQGTITQGLAGRVLVVHASLFDNATGGNAQNYLFYPKVNGLEMEPTASWDSGGGFASFATPSSGTGWATGSGTWWIDLDSQGLVGQQLTVQIWASATPFSGNNFRKVDVSMVAIMQTK